MNLYPTEFDRSVRTASVGRMPQRCIAIGGMSTRPVPGQRALSARSFRRPSPARSGLNLSDVLACIAAALA